MLLASNYLRVAALARRAGDAAKAAEYSGKAEATILEGLKKSPDELSLYANAAELAWRGGDKQGALNRLQEATARPKLRDHPGLHALIGGFYQRMGTDSYAKAEQEYLAAVSLSKNSLPAQQQLALFYRAAAASYAANGSSEQAKAAADKAVKALSSIARQIAAESAKLQGSSLERARAELTEVRSALVDLMVKSGGPNDAEKWIAGAMKDNPGDVDLRVLHAMVMIAPGAARSCTD